MSAGVLTLDAAHAYFSTGTGDVMRVPLSGGMSERLIKGQSVSNLPGSLAIQNHQLYWATPCSNDAPGGISIFRLRYCLGHQPRRARPHHLPTRGVEGLAGARQRRERGRAARLGASRGRDTRSVDERQHERLRHRHVFADRRTAAEAVTYLGSVGGLCLLRFSEVRCTVGGRDCSVMEHRIRSPAPSETPAVLVFLVAYHEARTILGHAQTHCVAGPVLTPFFEQNIGPEIPRQAQHD